MKTPTALSFVLSDPLLSDSLGLAGTAFISAGRRPDQPCAKMHPTAGRREDSVAAYLRANRADRRRVVGVRVPTIRTRDPCHFDTRKPRQPDRQRSHQFLRLTRQAPHRIPEFAFGPNARNSQ